MSAKRAFKAAIICVAGVSLSGCVAAAIPALAGAAITRTATDGKEAGKAEAPKQAAVAKPDAAAAEAARAQIAQLAQGESVGKTSPQPSAAAVAMRTGPYSDFVIYASGRKIVDPALLTPGEEPTYSATLADPTSLSAKRRPCQSLTPTVLIDLDPAGTVFSPGTTVAPPLSFADGLASLREQKVSIAWISGTSAAYAGDVRAALKSSGLDPEAADELLLMRYPADRKQTRREDLAASSCLLAIAGDTREDFDELYDYLVNPEAALALELLIGDGWFLLPGLTRPPEQSPTTLADGKP